MLKLMQDKIGLNWQYYGARMFDAQLGRFHSADPLAELFSSQSAYVYAINNPVNFIDYLGMGPEKYGADGLTTDQWIQSSRPGADPGLGKYFRNFNRMIESEKKNNGLQEDKQGNYYYLKNVGYKTGKNSFFNGESWKEAGPAFGFYEKKVPLYAAGQGGLDWTFYTSAVLTAAEKSLYSKEFGTWMGKDLKFRSQAWGGNGVTGGKNAFAKNWSGNVGLLGKAVGAYSMYGSYIEWERGEISNELFAGDMVSGLAGIFGGIIGASWSIGWELGKNYGPSKWFAPKPQESIILEYLKTNKIEY